MQENRSKQVMRKFRGQEEPFLTVPSAASRASSSVAIAPDQDEKKKERKKGEGKKKERSGFSLKKACWRSKSWWSLYRPFFCPSVNMFSIAKQWLGSSDRLTVLLTESKHWLK